MPRPRRFRRISKQPEFSYFKPRGVCLRDLEEVKLNVEELEAVRLKDSLGLDQVKAAKKMEKCDRVLMPLPKGSEDFLGTALAVAKPHAVVHFYQFSPDSDPFTAAIDKIKKAAAKAKRKVKIKKKKWVRSHAPRVSQVVIDFEVI